MFYESTNQQHELPVLAMFVNTSKMSNLSLKLFGQMNRNVVGSIYGRPSIKIAHLDPLTNMASTGNSCC
jgi:hypothetical protein